MINVNRIKVKHTDYGLYLTTQTKKSKYGQAYSIGKPNKPNNVNSIDEAKSRFIKFYNQYE